MQAEASLNAFLMITEQACKVVQPRKGIVKIMMALVMSDTRVKAMTVTMIMAVLVMMAAMLIMMG